MSWLEERFTTHEGRPLRYLTGGSGPPMLLCHGFIGSAENFDDWFPELLQRRTVVVPDLPGFGKSAPLASRHDGMSLACATLAAADDDALSRARKMGRRTACAHAASVTADCDGSGRSSRNAAMNSR